MERLGFKLEQAVVTGLPMHCCEALGTNSHAARYWVRWPVACELVQDYSHLQPQGTNRTRKPFRSSGPLPHSSQSVCYDSSTLHECGHSPASSALNRLRPRGTSLRGRLCLKGLAGLVRLPLVKHKHTEASSKSLETRQRHSWCTPLLPLASGTGLKIHSTPSTCTRSDAAGHGMCVEARKTAAVKGQCHTKLRSNASTPMR